MNPIQQHVWGRQRPFVMTIDTTKTSTGSTANGLFKLPLIPTGTYNFKVNWGDGTPVQTITVYNQAETTHTYAPTGIYTITITGTIVGWRFAATGDRLKPLSVKYWGPLRLGPPPGGTGTTGSPWNGCTNLRLDSVLDGWIFTQNIASMIAFLGSGTVNMPGLTSVARITEWKFPPGVNVDQGMRLLSGFNQNINDLDMSPFGALTNMFHTCSVYNQPMDKWNMSNVTTMANMFVNADALNQDVSMWNLSKCIDMSGFLSGAAVFNQNMNGWNNPVTGPIICADFGTAFSGCTSFNNGLASGVSGVMSINTISGTSYISMFNNCVNFNQDVSGWNMNAATVLTTMFNGCAKFNQNLNAWGSQLVGVGAMNGMFTGCTIFNNGQASGVGTPGLIWDTSTFTTSGSVFSNCTAFNQNLDSWNTQNFNSLNLHFNNCTNFNNGRAPGVPGSFGYITPKVTLMTSTFLNAVSFNCDISHWDCRLVTDFGSMFQGATTFNNGGQPGISNWPLNLTTGLLMPMDLMFSGCIAFNQPLNGWNTTRVQLMNSMFSGCTVFNNGLASGVSGTMLWDTQRVTTMANMFQNCPAFNQNISGWQLVGVGATTNISFMFNNATSFNQKLDAWDTTSITTMSSTFLGATAFNNGELSGVLSPMLWETGNVTTMLSTFQDCPNFNCDLVTNGAIWDVRKVTTFVNMFNGCTLFNGSLAGWDTAATGLTSLSSMFNTARAFNQPVSHFKTSFVTSMASMFFSALEFNQPLTTSGILWDVSKVTTFFAMFTGANKFNQDLSSWQINTVSATVNMQQMFSSADAFNQNIGMWNMSKVNNLSSFMAGKTPSTFSSANLDAIYNGWITKNLTGAIAGGISFGTAKYTVASAEGRALMSRANTNPVITAITNVGGLFRITTAAHGLITGQKVYVLPNANYPAATGAWTVTVISTTVVELQGSVFAGTGTAGGNMRTGFGWAITDGGSTMLDNIVASYTLNSVLTDATGLSPTATMVGITYIAGKTGNAAVFNAVTDLIDIADTPNLSFTDGVGNDIAMSMNLWVYFTGFSPTGNWLFNKRGNTDTDQEWQLVYNTATSRLNFTKKDRVNASTANQSIASPASPFALSTWYNITITDDGTKTLAGMKMYINAVAQTTTDNSIGVYTGMPNTTSIARMGQASFAVNDPAFAHQGYLEDVSVWKGKVLSQAEITHIYNNGVGKTYPFL